MDSRVATLLVMAYGNPVGTALAAISLCSVAGHRD